MSLVQKLQERTGPSQSSRGKVYVKEYDVWDIPDLYLKRWKFNEWDYYSDKVQLPIKARGLFTLNDRIIARGYNKFFNVGEVKTTNPNYLANETQGPYFATVKENGFLTLISGYNKKLVVTSKNSCGPCSSFEDGKNYSKTARDMVLAGLAKIGKTEAEFADYLESNNFTAVGEVCDDRFEEHVLPYSPEQAGVYLNGLNHNTELFITEPMTVVQQVSDQFGFKKTDFVEFQTYDELQKFLKESSATGSWGSREVEGFVIRCKVDGNDFFYKYKFEEPYLMYRQWREVCKIYITKNLEAAAAYAQRSKHKESCLKFLMFARMYLNEHPELVGKLKTQNLGIIEMRTEFLESDDLESLLSQIQLTTKKTTLIPAATIGCGKSTVARALTYLCDFGHVQNDSIKGRSKFATFTKSIMNEFREKDVVFVDRNNSSFRERQQLLDFFDENGPASGYEFTDICLNFLPNGVDPEIQKLTRERIEARGDNHQTIPAKSLGSNGVNRIMKQFEGRFNTVDDERPPDNRFDKIIDLVAGDTENNVRTILRALNIEKSDEEVHNAVTKAIGFVETNTSPAPKPPAKSDKSKKNQTSKIQSQTKAVYFGARVPSEVRKELVEFAKPYLPPGIQVQRVFHVTLAHKNSHKEEFDSFVKQYGMPTGDKSKAKMNCKVTAFGYNDQIAAFRVEMPESANQTPHITVGTKPPVKPVAAKTLFENGVATEIVPMDITISDMQLYSA